MKTVIVTGAAGNLGKSVVEKFIAAGDKVIGTVTASSDTVIPESSFEQVTADLTDESATGKMVAAIIEKYGSIDTAVLTVGGFAKGDVLSTSIADINKQVQLNFHTAYTVARPLFAQMLQQKNGRIFLIGSQPGLHARSGKDMVAYSLAKSLLFQLAAIMNAEAKGLHVVTTVVVPSTIDTPQNRSAMPDADFSTWVKPEAIADAIYFYSTDEAAKLKEPILEF